MQTIVSKFGGSSTANADRFRRIYSIVRASPARRCVVLSAPGTDDEHKEKVTAMLEACWRHRNDEALLERATEMVMERFREITDGLSMPDMDELVREEIKRAVSISLPHTLSRGEYLCALLFSRWSGIPMADAADLIAFDNDGRLDEARTHARFASMDFRGDIFVMPGFYGADPSGHVHTFPRNGSDISGALAAEGLRAGLYENWSDVPGLMTADPSIVPQTRPISQVSYCQMRALARAGAQVLHPACLDPVAMAGIPTRLRSTLRTECFGTLVNEHCDRVAPVIVGLRDPEGEPGAALITVFGFPSKTVMPAAEALKPLGTEILPDRVVLRVRREDCDRAIRHLHRTLLE